MEKWLNTRHVQKHDIEVNWLKAKNFIPLQGELIIYDIEVDSTGNTLELPTDRTTPYTYARFKIGDGITNVNTLPFADAALNIRAGTGGGSVLSLPAAGPDWANEATKSDAIALGVGCKALNTRSVAMQNQTWSPGHTAFTIGQVNKNWANGSFMFGNGNIGGTPVYEADGVTPKAASDPGSQYSIIGGKDNNHRGQHSMTIGEANTVTSSWTGSIRATATIGLKNTVKDSIASAIFGSENIVDGTDLEYGASYNLVAGLNNNLRSDYSAIVGLKNTINHENGSGHSFVAGVNNYTQADATFLLGRGLYSTNIDQTIVGKYNHFLLFSF